MKFSKVFCKIAGRKIERSLFLSHMIKSAVSNVIINCLTIKYISVVNNRLNDK